MKLVVAALATTFLSSAVPARAQDPPPRIPVVVIDVHGTFPRFPKDPLLADSRGITAAEMPGMGRGVQAGVHLRVVKMKAITLGVGGQAMIGRSKQTPPPEQQDELQAVTETFRTISAQLSLNFGTGNGWSYVSGGLGRSQWSIVPEGLDPLPGDEEVLRTFNYGGGARWFPKTHLAFSFDVRFHAVDPGVVSSLPGRPPSPRTRFLVLAAGISLK
jgi:hypothetical protein